MRLKGSGQGAASFFVFRKCRECLARPDGLPKSDRPWSGRRESNPRMQLGKLHQSEANQKDSCKTAPFEPQTDQRVTDRAQNSKQSIEPRSPHLLSSPIFRKAATDPNLVAGYMSGEVATTPARKVQRRAFDGFLGRFTKRPYRRCPNREASRNRRRKLGGSGALPANLRDHYTEGERAVLCVVASEIKRQGICDWPIDKIAAYAGVCRTLAQGALRQAKRRGHLSITERPVQGRKHLTNIVHICCNEWLAWLKRGFATACLIGLKPVKNLSTTEIIELRKKEAGNEMGPSDPISATTKGPRSLRPAFA